MIDQEGNVTTLQYDKRGRRTWLVDPDRGATRTDYNGFGEVTSQENALGQVEALRRARRLASIDYPAVPERPQFSVEYAYTPQNYHPALRRFLTPDPLVAFPLFGQAYNRFSFCLNNPLRFLDPTGFRSIIAPDDNATPSHPDGLVIPRRKPVSAARPRKPPTSSGKPLQGGANGAAPANADANGNETSTGPRAPAVAPPSVTPPAAAEAASEPPTAAPVATASTGAAAPPLGPPPPSSMDAGEPAETQEPRSWRDNGVVPIVGGYIAGLALGMVPAGAVRAAHRVRRHAERAGVHALERGRAYGPGQGVFGSSGAPPSAPPASAAPGEARI